MAGGMDLGTSSKGGKKALDSAINLVPFIDLMAVLIVFLIMSAVWTQLGRLQVAQSGGISDALPVEHVDLRVWPDWETFERELPSLGDAFFFSTKATQVYWDAPLGASENVVLVFGRETAGMPADLHARYRERFVTMPIHSALVRSLNLSTSVAIAVYETLRQREGTSTH